MALANKFGGLLITTGNKIEYAVGCATIYGDMCGGYAPLTDLYTTEVFAVAKWRNAVAGAPVIPQAVTARPPSAELRETQIGRAHVRTPVTTTHLVSRHLREKNINAQRTERIQ